MIRDVLKASHDLPSSAHFGVSKTLFRLQCFVCWKGMYTDVAGYVHSCRSCQFRKMPTGKPQGLQSYIPVASQAFQVMATDVLGPISLTESGHKYILSVTDQLTKWSISICIKDLIDDTTAKAIEENVFYKYGAPSILISDQGTNFRSSDFEEFLETWGVRHHRSSPAHPQSNEMIEKFKGTLAMLLHSLASHNPTNWDLYVPMAVYSYNVSWNVATKMTLYYLVFGIDPEPIFLKKINCSPPDLHHSITLEQARTQAKAHIEAVQRKNMTRINAHRTASRIEVGNQVLVLSKPLKIQKGGKIADRWIMPFLVTHKLSDNVFEISTTTRRKKIPVENSLSIKRYFPRGEFELCYERVERMKQTPPSQTTIATIIERPDCEVLDTYFIENILLSETIGITFIDDSPNERITNNYKEECLDSDGRSHKLSNGEPKQFLNVSPEEIFIRCLFAIDSQKLLSLLSKDGRVVSGRLRRPSSAPGGSRNYPTVQPPARKRCHTLSDFRQFRKRLSLYEGFRYSPLRWPAANRRRGPSRSRSAPKCLYCESRLRWAVQSHPHTQHFQSRASQRQR